jgi:hypothetical protein
VATKPSKFSSIFLNEEEPVTEEEMKVLTIPPTIEKETTPQPVAVEATSTPEQGSETPRRMGRPATGKKSDPSYRQVTAYVRKDLYRNVSDALYDESRGLDTKRKEFSELVDELLEQWWQDRTKNSD